MFHLRTGTPGAGKTLSLITELKNIKDRPIFYFGIPELSPDLGWHLIDDPLNYHLSLPEGSIFVLDECQKIFPVRSPKLSVPDAISFIETHRHKGIDIHFITQHPSLLDHHARRLVGHHTHLQRNFGLSFSVKYTNNKLFDYSNFHELATCQKETFKFPKSSFNLYKSSEVHTHKARLPFKLLFIFPALALIIGCFFYARNTLFKDDVKIDTDTAVSAVDSAKSAASSFLPTQAIEHKQINWSTAYVPAVTGLPHTAPIYADIAKPTTFPVVVGCVATKIKCQCYTQQATRVDMPDALCRDQVKQHAFNPFKRDQDRDQDRDHVAMTNSVSQVSQPVSVAPPVNFYQNFTSPSVDDDAM